jgi:phospholipid/cholesterol/gamma-HCH transport system substrate-binding protein
VRRTFIALFAFLVLFALGLWLGNRQGMIPGYAQLRSYTDDASGLTDGTKVRLNGVPIGYLDHQRLTGSRDAQRAVEFDMKVQARYLTRIPVDSRVGVVADNLLSDKSIDITQGHSTEHVEPGAELRSSEAVDPNRMMAEMGNALAGFQGVLDRVNGLLAGINQGVGSAGKLSQHWKEDFADISTETDALLKDARNAHGTLDHVLVHNDELTKQMQTTQGRIHDIMAGFQSGQGTAGKLGSLQQDLDQTMKDIDQLQAAMKARSNDFGALQKRFDAVSTKFNGIMERVNAGQGSVGQFLVNPQLSDSLAAVGREFQEFAKDLQANPRKFATFRLGLF